jgi:hypothetical protein
MFIEFELNQPKAKLKKNTTYKKLILNVYTIIYYNIVFIYYMYYILYILFYIYY